LFLYEHRETVNLLSRQCRTWARERFSVELMVHNIQEVYERCFASNRVDPAEHLVSPVAPLSQQSG
jgi:hypothetical protein